MVKKLNNEEEMSRVSGGVRYVLIENPGKKGSWAYYFDNQDELENFITSQFESGTHFLSFKTNSDYVGSRIFENDESAEEFLKECTIEDDLIKNPIKMYEMGVMSGYDISNIENAINFGK